MMVQSKNRYWHRVGLAVSRYAETFPECTVTRNLIGAITKTLLLQSDGMYAIDGLKKHQANPRAEGSSV